MNTKIDHSVLIKMIRGDKASRSQAIKSIANDTLLKNKVIALVRNNSGDSTDGETIFHDAIVTMVKTIFTKPDYEISTHLHAYMLGVARNLWMNELRKRGRHQTAPLEYAENQPSDSDQVKLLMTGERSKVLRAVLKQMKVNCKDVLLHWSAGFSMKEIAVKLGYKTEGVVRKKKSECMKELYAYLGNNQHIVERLRIV